CHSPLVLDGGVSQAAYRSDRLTIQTQFFFNKDLEYLRYGNKGSCPALSISKMKAAWYPDFGLELLMPEQLWIEDGHLDHLPGSDKCMLSTVVKIWTRNLVIRQRVEDFQLGIESYHKQLNLTKPGWDATGYEFKHDYTIIESPRAVVFSTQKDVTTSKEFMAAIERRLKTRRNFRNLECFVGGRVRDIDCRLLQRTE
ncbi:hypothetical protein Tco_0039726, partial [Tanacetum coccineum]